MKTPSPKVLQRGGDPCSGRESVMESLDLKGWERLRLGEGRKLCPGQES